MVADTHTDRDESGVFPRKIKPPLSLHFCASAGSGMPATKSASKARARRYADLRLATTYIPDSARSKALPPTRAHDADFLDWANVPLLVACTVAANREPTCRPDDMWISQVLLCRKPWLIDHTHSVFVEKLLCIATNRSQETRCVPAVGLTIQA
jgi:hypothetical protein